MQLQSYAEDRWQNGAGRTSRLVDASTGEAVAEAASGGLDYRAMLAHAHSGFSSRHSILFVSRGTLEQGAGHFSYGFLVRLTAMSEGRDVSGLSH